MIPGSLKNSVSSANGTQSKRGLTGGVDDLPGPAGEAGVNEPGTSQPGPTTLQSLTDTANAAFESTNQGISNATTTVAEKVKGTLGTGNNKNFGSSDEPLPPTTIPTTTGEGAGVGDLPGTASETSVAKLPLEREMEKQPYLGPRGLSDLIERHSETDFQQSKQSDLVSPQGLKEKSTAAAFIDRRIPTPDPEVPATQTKLIPDPTLDEHGPSAAVPHGIPEHETAQRISADKDVKKAASKSGGVDKFNVSHVDPYGHKDPHAPSPPPKDDVPSKSRVSSEGTGTRFTEAVNSPPEHVIDAGHSRHNRSGSTSSNGSKIRFRDKIKGEMKVLSGKVTKNEAKVEEGKAILAGEKA
jgi:hypothetical protein